MNKFDVHSAKFLSIIIGICFIFIMVIWNAFSYLPQKTEDNVATNQEFNLPTDEDTEEKQASEEINSEEEIKEEYTEVKFDSRKHEKRQAMVEETSSDEPEPLESISEDGTNFENQDKEVETASPLEQALESAKNYRQSHKYANAIAEYQKAVSLTDDNSIKAQCYENIAKIYANSKRYGSALSFAQKAFNTQPSTAREVLLARLYYKTGDVDKATTRINNVLQRDFAID